MQVGAVLQIFKRQWAWFLTPIILLPLITSIQLAHHPKQYTAATDLLFLPVTSSSYALQPDRLLQWLNTPDFKEKVSNLYQEKLDSDKPISYQVNYSLDPAKTTLHVQFIDTDKAMAMTMAGKIAQAIEGETQTLIRAPYEEIQSHLRDKMAQIKMSDIPKATTKPPSPSTALIADAKRLEQENFSHTRLLQLQTELDRFETLNEPEEVLQPTGIISISPYVKIPWQHPVCIALLLAPLVGCFLMMGAEKRLGHIYNLADVETYLQLPVLQTIQVDKQLTKASGKIQKDILTSLPAPASAKSLINPTTQKALYQDLLGVKCQLLHMGSVGKKVLSVLSPEPGSGTTFLVANLGRLYAESGMKTLIIEGNLRVPELHHVFSAAETPGLTDLLSGKAHIKETLQQKDKNLFVLSAGSLQQDPLFYLGHQNLALVLEHMQRFFDVILINTPSNMDLPDATVLANMSQAVLLNIRESDLTMSKINQWQSQLAKIQTEKLGLVVNFKVV